MALGIWDYLDNGGSLLPVTTEANRGGLLPIERRRHTGGLLDPDHVLLEASALQPAHRTLGRGHYSRARQASAPLRGRVSAPAPANPAIERLKNDPLLNDAQRVEIAAAAERGRARHAGQTAVDVGFGDRLWENANAGFLGLDNVIPGNLASAFYHGAANGRPEQERAEYLDGLIKAMTAEIAKHPPDSPERVALQAQLDETRKEAKRLEVTATGKRLNHGRSMAEVEGAYEALPEANTIGGKAAAVIGQGIGMTASPENFILPGAAPIARTASPILNRVIAGAVTQGTINAGLDPALQAANVQRGAQEGHDPAGTALNAAVGALFGGALNVTTAMVSQVRNWVAAKLGKAPGQVTARDVTETVDASIFEDLGSARAANEPPSTSVAAQEARKQLPAPRIQELYESHPGLDEALATIPKLRESVLSGNVRVDKDFVTRFRNSGPLVDRLIREGEARRAKLTSHQRRVLEVMRRKRQEVPSRPGDAPAWHGRDGTRTPGEPVEPFSRTPEMDQGLVDFAKQCMEVGDRHLRRDLGAVTPEEVARIKERTGLDVTGYRRETDNYGLRHIIQQHGDAATEKARGQLPVSREHIGLIPWIVRTTEPEKSKRRSRRHDLPVIQYEKRINGTVIYYEEVRSKENGALVPHGMYIKDARK